MSRTFSTIGVVGLGTMGAGIAEVFARNGVDVIGVERDEDQLARGRSHLEHSTGRAVARGKLSTDEQAELVGRVTFTTSIADVKECDLVVEAVVEHLDLKRAIFTELDTIVAPEAVLATNTSSLSVTEIAAATSHPHRVVGLHFFNPAPVQAFVEVIRTVVTEADVVTDVQELARRLGKNPVVAGDKAGFIANALLFGYLNHAASLYQDHHASREDIDDAMRLGCRYPMGPLSLLDLIGLDTAYEILETMYLQGRDRLHAPAPVLKQMVTAGMLGRKSGRGFYAYDGPDSPVVVADSQTPAADAVPLMRRDIATIAVVGSEAMAAGIAEACTTARFEVVRVPDGGRLDDVRDADLVIEATPDRLSEKTALFEQLDEICKPGAILATTTSSLPVIECAAVTNRPADVVGMHFFEPAAQTPLVEVVSTVATGDDVAGTVRATCSLLGKHPVSCGDRAGFIANALLFPYLNDAVKMLQAHYATADDIDTAMKQGCRLPMGPFELLDVVGNDVSLTIQRTLYQEFREPGFAPAPLLEHLVTAGYLGVKTGRGFRDHAH